MYRSVKSPLDRPTRGAFLQKTALINRSMGGGGGNEAACGGGGRRRRRRVTGGRRRNNSLSRAPGADRRFKLIATRVISFSIPLGLVNERPAIIAR